MTDAGREKIIGLVPLWEGLGGWICAILFMLGHYDFGFWIGIGVVITGHSAGFWMLFSQLDAISKTKRPEGGPLRVASPPKGAGYIVPEELK